MCLARIPISYTILQVVHKGYLDTTTNIIYTHPQHTDCQMADQIPLQWEGKQWLYNQNRTLQNATSPWTLYWAPYNIDLQLTASPLAFHQLILYNITDFPNIAADDYFAQMHIQTKTLCELGLTVARKQSNCKINFASNIMSFGLLSFLYGGDISFYQIWIFIVCLIVTASTVLQISVFCFKRIFKRFCTPQQQRIAAITTHMPTTLDTEPNCQHESPDATSDTPLLTSQTNEHSTSMSLQEDQDDGR